MIKSKWDQTKEYFIAYSILINAAQHHGYATYQEIAQVVGLPTAGNYMSSQIGEILGIISANEAKEGRPMLSAIAVGTNGKPGKGFIPGKGFGFFQRGRGRGCLLGTSVRKFTRNGKFLTAPVTRKMLD
jgi:hypothetical protein